MKGILKFLYYVSAYASNIGFILGGLLIHLWTVYMTFETMGLIWAIVSFFAPVISQLFWMYTLTMEIGFFNGYNVLIIALVVLRYIFAFISALTASKLEKMEQDNYTY